MIGSIQDWLETYPSLGPYLGLAGALAAAYFLYFITNMLVNRALKRIFDRSATQLDNIRLEQGVFHRLTYLVPALILYNFAYLLPAYSGPTQQFLAAVSTGIVVLTLGALLSAVGEYGQRLEFTKRFGLKSYLQVAKLLLYIFGALITVAILIGRSPWVLLSGLGALTAVLLLVFRDTILSFVAGLQISSNNLLEVGDWIEMPLYGADGDVIEIALHTIKVQNWDKTITSIPTYKLLEGSFKNWQGMSRSGGRRIKRAIHIDMSSIRLCDQTMLESYAKIDLLKEHIHNKRAEVEAWNREHGIDETSLINGRRLTNIGSFRAYIEAYLRSHPSVHQEMTLMVRQLDPGPDGLPVEIYLFTNTTDWIAYERIQADIFDHLLAVVPQFGLQVFQHPTGADFKTMVRG